MSKNVDKPPPKVKRRLLDDIDVMASSLKKSRNENSTTQSCSKRKVPTKKGKEIINNVTGKILQLAKRKKSVKKGDNNNAVPCDRSSLVQMNKLMSTKVVPIIQTRGMKAKAINGLMVEIMQDGQSSELEKLNEIDAMTQNEIVDGEAVLNEIDHDGVELSVQGSDNEFAAEEGEIENASTAVTEPGEITSSEGDDEEVEVQRKTCSIQSG